MLRYSRTSNIVVYSLTKLRYIKMRHLNLFFLSFTILLLSVINLKASSFSHTLYLSSDLPLLASDTSKHHFKKSSYGTKVWKNQDRYVGEMRFGKPHGKGTMFFADGTIYKGEFWLGRREGWGEQKFVDGDLYEGEWEEDYIHGNGAYTFATGQEYIGAFQYGEIEGEGSMTLESGDTYTGGWLEGLANGFGTLTRKDGSKHAGFRIEGKRNGEGTIVWEKGDSIVANWKDGELSGLVTFYFNNGDQYQTEWKKDQWSKNGTYTHHEGQFIKASLTDFESPSDDFKAMSALENISLIWYSLALECSDNQNFDQALEYLKNAKQLVPNDSNEATMIATQYDQLKSKKSGWAKLNDN